MIVFLGKKYVTDKEASSIYNYSRAWFQKKREEKSGPPYTRIGPKRVYYEIIKLEEWFKLNTEEF